MLAVGLEKSQADRWWPDADGAPRLELPGERVTRFMDGPLLKLRQAAAPYPSVSIHMIDLLARLPGAEAGDERVRAFLLQHADAMAEHATASAAIDQDLAGIASALANARRRLCPPDGS